MVAHKGQQGQPPYLGHSRKPGILPGLFACEKNFENLENTS